MPEGITAAYTDETALFKNLKTINQSGYKLKVIQQSYPAGGVRTRPPNT
jgi:hypothetical protein